MQHAGSTEGRRFYSNAAHFRPERTTPVLDQLVSDARMRIALGLEDEELLRAGMLAYLQMGESESGRLGKWWFQSSGPAVEWANRPPAP